MDLLHRIAPLFDGWEEALIWSCLDGCMGTAAADDSALPRAARITVGDFCFFAGEPDDALIATATAPILTPRDARWCAAMERVLGGSAVRATRYAIPKDPTVFDPARLKALAVPPAGYALAPIDTVLYGKALDRAWSRDFCALFRDAEDYARRGAGIAALHDGELVAGASSYAVYAGRETGEDGPCAEARRRGGIEIEIDTRPDHRRRGLATACGAALILSCLSRGLYPSWDAHDLRSVALAEKLGYRSGVPYPVYLRSD